jgi:hypothetical protein
MGEALPEAGVLQEIWTGIRGNGVAELTGHRSYKGLPREARILGALRVDSQMDNFGARYSALVIPPKDGEYTFWIASDDNSELWLSTDAAEENLAKIASVGGYTGREAWDATKSQKSKAVALKKGGRYFLRAFHKDGGGDDHVAVAWSGPGLPRAVLGATYLRVPKLAPKTAKLVQRIRTEEKHRAELLAALLATPPKGVPAFSQGLPQKDREQLGGELFALAGRIQRKVAGEDAAGLARYAQLAGSVVPTAEVPVEDAVLRGLLVIEDLYLKSLSVDELVGRGAHRASRAFGAIPASAQGVASVVRLSSNDTKKGSELVSTGLYALPGKPVVVELPEALADQELSLQIGHHLDAKEKTKSFDSMPCSSRRFPLSATSTRAISPHGGLLFVQVPASVGLKDAKVEIAGAIQAPRFVLGQTTDEEWKSIRNFPGPWGELATDNYILVAHSEALRKLDNPTDLMTWWRGNVAAHEGFYNYSIGKPFRMHTVHYAVRGFSTWPLYETKESVANLLDLRGISSYNDGLFLHEHGHHCDSSAMMFGNLGESTPNWAGYYMKATNGDFAWKDAEDTHLSRLLSGEGSHQELKQDGWWTTKYTHYWSYPVTSMMVGYVRGFGWESFKTVVHRFTLADDPVNQLPMFQNAAAGKRDRAAVDQSKIDKWLIFLSQEAKHDVRPYFAHFCLRPSAEAASYIDALKLPKWDLVYSPVRRVAVAPGQAVTIPSPVNDARTFAGAVKLAGIAKPPHGTLTARDGGYVYRADKGYVGEVRIPFQLSNVYGNTCRGTIRVHVMPDRDNPHLAMGEAAKVSTSGWTKIAFPRRYRRPVVVATIDLKENPGLVTRVRKVSPMGCEVMLQRIDGGTDAAACSATWAVLEAGEYSEKRNMLTADVGTVDVSPEGMGRQAVGALRSYEQKAALLRGVTLGQVQSFEDSKWTRFFWRDERGELGIRVGCHYGKDELPRTNETVGFLRLAHGLYQFGDTTFRIDASGIKTPALSLRMAYACFNGWGFRSVERYFAKK